MAEEVVLPTETPWEQLTDQGENALWYGRFLMYRDMGPRFLRSNTFIICSTWERSITGEDAMEMECK